MARAGRSRKLRLKPADSFDLIRLLARSQHDPRKAVCELVQNSLDASAERIEITWFNEAGHRCLRILDNGVGIFPDLEREPALERIARTIGHSHKRALNPEERRQQMMLGQYGIGLLGFWSVGIRMEIRSRVGGGESWALHLTEDDPQAEVLRCPPRRLAEEPNSTEITIRGVHEGAKRQIRPPRLQAYLAGELRGQLLNREVELTIRDRVGRGRARKFFTVEPRRFLGTPLRDLRELPVPGHGSASIELYLLSTEEARRGQVSLACGGTTVLNDLAELDGNDDGSTRAPWNSGRIEGVIDFAELSVSPGTRRGFQRDGAALAFLAALESVETELVGRIEQTEKEQEQAAHQEVAKKIRRAFAPVATALPEYDMLEITAGPGRTKEDDQGSREEREGAPLEAGVDPTQSDASTEKTDGAEFAPEESEPSDDVLFPAGPIARVRIEPASVVLPPGAVRWFRARAVDGDGRVVGGTVTYHWRLHGPGDLSARASRARYGSPPFSGRAVLQVEVEQGDHHAEASVEIETNEELRGIEKASGIPEPHPVHAAGEPWRSRFVEDRWEFNSAHRDFLAAAEQESTRLRYLIHLFAKELVVLNFGGPESEPLLERMVEVLTHLGQRRPPAAK